MKTIKVSCWSGIKFVNVWLFEGDLSSHQPKIILQCLPISATSLCLFVWDSLRRCQFGEATVAGYSIQH